MKKRERDTERDSKKVKRERSVSKDIVALISTISAVLLILTLLLQQALENI